MANLTAESFSSSFCFSSSTISHVPFISFIEFSMDFRNSSFSNNLFCRSTTCSLSEISSSPATPVEDSSAWESSTRWVFKDGVWAVLLFFVRRLCKKKIWINQITHEKRKSGLKIAPLDYLKVPEYNSRKLGACTTDAVSYPDDDESTLAKKKFFFLIWFTFSIATSSGLLKNEKHSKENICHYHERFN